MSGMRLACTSWVDYAAAMRKPLFALACLLLAAGCTSDDSLPVDGSGVIPSGSEASASGLPTASPSPTPPEKPTVRNARLEGKYFVKYTLLTSNVGDTNDTEKNNWRIEARCKQGGACPVRVQSLTNKWTASAVFRKGRYQWARSLHAAYTCGSGSTVDYNIAANYTYEITSRRQALIGDEWTVTRFDGTFSANGTKGCGLSGPPKERFAITGSLLGRS